jgi:hypothetical protein
VLVEELSKATTALSGVVRDLDGDALSGADAALLVERFSVISRLAAAGIALCAKRVNETRFFERCGHKSAESWLGDRTGEPAGSARSVIATGGLLSDLPELEGAFRAGELSSEQAAQVARGGAADPASARQLLDHAKTGSLRELRAEADKLEAAARSREEDEARHARIRAGRHLRTWLDADGSFKGRFSLTADDGALLLSGIEREANHLFDLSRRAGLREAREAYLADALVAVVSGQSAGAASLEGQRRPWPDSPVGTRANTIGTAATTTPTAANSTDGAPMTAPQHPLAGEAGGGAGADVACAGGGAEGGEGGEIAGDRRPLRSRRPDCTILFHVSLEALRRGALAPGEECVVDGVGHVPLSVVQRYLDTARIRLVVKNGYDVASVFSCTRSIPAGVQTALIARDRVCVVPGCASSFQLEIDHIVEFAKGGMTKLSNLCRLCRPHHAMKTQEGYRIEGGPGSWRWIPPPGAAPERRPPTAEATAGGAGTAPEPRGGESPAVRRIPVAQQGSLQLD